MRELHITIEATVKIQDGILEGSISEWLCRERVGRKLSRVQLSQMSGVSSSEIGRIEKRERTPGFDIVQKLQKALERVQTLSLI